MVSKFYLGFLANSPLTFPIKRKAKKCSRKMDWLEQKMSFPKAKIPSGLGNGHKFSSGIENGKGNGERILAPTPSDMSKNGKFTEKDGKNGREILGHI